MEKEGITMFPIIDKRKTGIHLRRLMDERGLAVKDIQKYLGLGSVQIKVLQEQTFFSTCTVSGSIHRPNFMP